MRKYLLPLLFCLPVIVYGYWGAFTKSGQKQYEEMAAMGPFFAMIGACFVLVVWLGILIFTDFRTYRKSKSK